MPKVTPDHIRKLSDMYYPAPNAENNYPLREKNSIFFKTLYVLDTTIVDPSTYQLQPEFDHPKI